MTEIQRKTEGTKPTEYPGLKECLIEANIRIRNGYTDHEQKENEVINPRRRIFTAKNDCDNIALPLDQHKH